MIQARLDEIAKIHPFRKIEYVYSDGQIKSVIIDVEDFLSMVETLKAESDSGLVQSKDSREDELLNKEATTMTIAEKREFAKFLKGRYRNYKTNSESFAVRKRAEIELEERSF